MLIEFGGATAPMPTPPSQAPAPDQTLPPADHVSIKPPKTGDGGLSYTVKRGDSLSKIAAEHGTDVRTLYELNRAAIGKDWNLIHVGLVLHLPTGVAQEKGRESTSNQQALAAPPPPAAASGPGSPLVPPRGPDDVGSSGPYAAPPTGWVAAYDLTNHQNTLAANAALIYDISQEYASRKGFADPAGFAAMAVAVMLIETGRTGNASAVGDGGLAVGLFQQHDNGRHLTRSQYQNPETASRIFAQDAFVQSKHGGYGSLGALAVANQRPRKDLRPGYIDEVNRLISSGEAARIAGR